tara:strand:- start:458 stop:715 length:258 start_codon:yes stop_codon:yes gene_type:complete
MKIKIILLMICFLLSFNQVFADNKDCNQFEKLSAKYIECNAKKLKENTAKQVDKGKKKFNNSTFKEKLIKFKNSKNLMDFLDKDK